MRHLLVAQQALEVGQGAVQLAGVVDSERGRHLAGVAPGEWAGVARFRVGWRSAVRSGATGSVDRGTEGLYDIDSMCVCVCARARTCVCVVVCI